LRAARRIALHDADAVVPGGADVAQQVVHVALQQGHLGGQLVRGEQLDRDDIVQAAQRAAGRRRQRVGLPGREVQAAADVTAQQVHHHQRGCQQADTQLQAPAGAARGRELPAQQRRVRQGEEETGQRQEIHHVAQVDDPAADAVEVRQHPDARRQPGQARRQPHQQWVQANQDEEEHQHGPEDEGRDLAPAQARSPGSDAGEPRGEQAGADVLGGHRRPGHRGTEAERERDRERERQRDPQEQHR
jgi:hypothetical protein